MKQIPCTPSSQGLFVGTKYASKYATGGHNLEDITISNKQNKQANNLNGWIK